MTSTQSAASVAPDTGACGHPGHHPGHQAGHQADHDHHADHERGDGSPATRPSIPLRLVIWYQRTFAGGTPTCRFYPSCSSYAREALEVHGTRRGLWLTTRRLLRCRPFGPSGVDPVPPPRTDVERAGAPADDLGKVR